MHARNLSDQLGGAQIYIKMEGLAQTGAHKVNNALGQALLAQRMGKKRIIAETGAGQHGVATAAVCARLGLECHVYMGEVDIRRQRPNVFLMELYGAEVIPVSSGSRTLKDAVNEALRDWAAHGEDTHYLLGSALGPSPYPDMVREFQSVIGREVQERLKEEKIKPDALVACVGGGSNAMGFFAPWLAGRQAGDSPRLVGVEAGGRGPGRGNHAVRMAGEGKKGIVQGYKSFFLQDEDGQLLETHSVSAGLDYPGIGPQLAWLGEQGLVEFTAARDKEALEALKRLARTEGIVFALESAHAAAAALKMAPGMSPREVIVLNMSGRGDKDIFITARELCPGPWKEFLQNEVKSL